MRFCMLKPAVSALLVAVLWGPAAAAERTYQVDFTVHHDGHDAVYTILVADGTCGDTTIKSEQREELFQVCAEPATDQRVHLDIERHSRDGTNESSTHAVVLATPGDSYEVLDATMVLTVQ